VARIRNCAAPGVASKKLPGDYSCNRNRDSYKPLNVITWKRFLNTPFLNTVAIL